MSSHSVLRTVIQAKSTAEATPEATAEDNSSVEPKFNVGGNELEAQLGILVENAPVALSMFDEQMRYIVANRSWIEEFGLQHVQPLIGRSQYEIFPGLHPGWRQVYDRALQGHVVRSEHDAISGQDGRPIVYRWEVRPWRRQLDASIGGLMVICEKFSSNLVPRVAAKDEAPLILDGGATRSGATHLFQSSLPIVILDGAGVILHTNDAAVSASLSRGICEGESHFWEAFGNGQDTGVLMEHTLAAVSKLAQDGEALSQTIVTRASSNSAVSEIDALVQPVRWVLSKTKSGDEQTRIVAVALLGSSPFDLGQTTEPDPKEQMLASSAQVESTTAMVRELQDQLARSQQEVTVLREAEQAFAKREGRQRAVLEALSCGVIVLDERGMPIYHNDHVGRLLGRAIQRGESIEQWLMHACPTDQHRERVATVWSQEVWSRQLTKTISLVTGDGLMKELEFRPITLLGGGVLVSIHDVTDQCRVEDLLQATEAKFRVLVQESPVAVLLTDGTGAVFEANPAAEALIGSSKADLRRMAIDEWLTPSSAAARREALRLMREEGRRVATLEVQIRSAGEGDLAANLRVALVTDADGLTHCALHFLQPVAALTAGASPRSLQAAKPVDDSTPNHGSGQPESVATPPAIVVRWLLQTDQSGRIANWSAEAQELFGFETSEVVGRWMHSLFRPSDPTGFYSALQDRSAAPDEAISWGYFGKDGRRGPARFFVKSAGEGGNAVDLFEEHSASVADVTSQPPGSMRTHIVKPSQLWPMVDLDREKLLLSETHHRIKNHLQIISSMLNLQLNSMADQGARAALRSSQNRVRSIAALHQHLYQLALGEGPGFDEFAAGLSQRLRECYDVPEQQVALRLEITAAHLQQEWMMPLALILNETLSNAFEHAFPSHRQGAVTVRLTLEGGTGEFEVSDDGVGLPEGFDPAIAPGLGLKILGVFADQMRGELRLSGTPEGGTKFNLRFPMAHVDN